MERNLAKIALNWANSRKMEIGFTLALGAAGLPLVGCFDSNADNSVTIRPSTPVAGAKISAEVTQTPTVLPTLTPEVPVIRDAKSDPATATPTATGTPDAGKTAEPAAATKSTQGSDTPPTPTAVPTPERTSQPTKTATPRPTATPTRTREAPRILTPEEIKARDQNLRKQLTGAINDYFESINKRKMDIDPALNDYAQTCADYMAGAGLWGHVCQSKPEIFKILQGWRGGAVYENTGERVVGAPFYTTSPISAHVNFLRDWQVSASHNEAMTSAQNRAFGVGCTTYTSPLSFSILPANNWIICVAEFGH